MTKTELLAVAKPILFNTEMVRTILERHKMTNPRPVYITPDYETISTIEQRQLAELIQSDLLNGFNQQDFQDVLSVFNRVCDRLLLIAKQEKEITEHEKDSNII